MTVPGTLVLQRNQRPTVLANRCSVGENRDGAGTATNGPRLLTEPPDHAGGRLMPTIIPEPPDTFKPPHCRAVV